MLKWLKGIYYILENKDLFCINQLLKDVNHESKVYTCLYSLISSTLHTQLLVFKRKLRLTTIRRCKTHLRFNEYFIVATSTIEEWDRKSTEKFWENSTKDTFSRSLEVTISKVSQWNKESWSTEESDCSSRKVSGAQKSLHSPYLFLSIN